MSQKVIEQLVQLIHNPLFLSAVSSWLISQFLKTVITLFTHSITSFKQFIELILWRTGGMPSSHSALVSSITTAIGFKNGINSDLFIFSCCFSLIVIRDAVGVRRSSGLQARTLNEFGTKVSGTLKIPFKPVKEIQGHRPMEVVAGILLGFL
ncbi:divergent PAP2 family protein [Brucepastera parasyntrophica]|uniref:divergent PAP2 family protein n=1 Tax=Brucepastera parasyntrophica TaxID=2880008 RepID=UPI00210C8689|nr:divergent PAP2 family protein [Brucepastera parasyntrophica]ULQ61105.1 divergent PAP2 family protein [Brucepastera parasyntrophica]